jgi:hypothetical protein
MIRPRGRCCTNPFLPEIRSTSAASTNRELYILWRHTQLDLGNHVREDARQAYLGLPQFPQRLGGKQLCPPCLLVKYRFRCCMLECGARKLLRTYYV